MTDLVLALDQGTTSSRAMLFDVRLAVRGVGQEELPQHFPSEGWVEHEPEDIWNTTISSARAALRQGRIEAGQVSGIGITNQRETVVVWDRRSGRPIHRAIVWQDRRTAAACARLRAEGIEPLVSERTGLVLDPYFSASKIGWLLDHVDGARMAAEAGHLAFGTVDAYLVWRLTGGRLHVTDATNAARTLLYDIRRGDWDDDLLRIFGVPRAMLPEVRDTAGYFGATEPDILGGAIAIRGVAGDQQAATIGQACFKPGMMKATYGTGCFALLNTGETPVTSSSRLLTTVAWQLGGKRTYALEGAIFVAGAAVQWLRDGLRLIGSAGETGALAAQSDPSQDVVLVPAFVGLGAPYWVPEARGALLGLTRAAGPAELARATLEAVGYQTRDLMEAMRRDWPGVAETVIRVDGGMVASDWMLQFLADILAAPVDRPTMLETTALGVAWLAGHQAGVWPDQEGFADQLRVERRFTPAMTSHERERRYRNWQRAVSAVVGYAAGDGV
ncbi:MAG: glycerol kinase GlpK [Hyphomicrobiaceae bacterium]